MFVIIHFFLAMLHCQSLNVNGLRSKQKQGMFFVQLKADILCLQETRWDNENEQNIKKIWDGEVYVKNGTKRSCGVAILVKKSVLDNVVCVHKDEKGRLIIIDGSYKEDKVRLINVYAPNNESERRDFFEEVGRWVNENTIIIGDFNVALMQIDISKNNVFKNDVSRSVLFKLCEQHNLADVWRMCYKNTKGFSRKQIVKGVLKQSRIDLCLATPAWVAKVKKVEYVENAWSDHMTMVLMLENRKDPRNGGLWVYNASLNDDETFKKSMCKLLNNAKEEMNYISDINEWWENLKIRIKKKCINFCKEKRWKESKRENDKYEKYSEERIGKH